MHREQDYLSEEELKQLIEETEHGEMLKAPVYLKSEIMDKIRMEEKEKKVIEMPQRSGISMTEKEKKRAYMRYRIKVAGIAAAAIFALFMIPTGTSNLKQSSLADEEKTSITGTINEKTNAWCSHLFEFSNGLIAPDSNKSTD